MGQILTKESYHIDGEMSTHFSLYFAGFFTAFSGEISPKKSRPEGSGRNLDAPYAHRSMMMWANILADSIRSSTFTRSSAPWRWVSNPGMVQPKATPPGMSWT